MRICSGVSNNQGLFLLVSQAQWVPGSALLQHPLLLITNKRTGFSPSPNTSTYSSLGQLENPLMAFMDTWLPWLSAWGHIIKWAGAGGSTKGGI